MQSASHKLCQRLYDSVKTKDEKLVARVYEADMERINKAAQREDEGTWQDLCRAILSANKT